ncbi:hypothetical protein [Novipirellula maiorica]|uniref:hypothetical protein n=1 Tax=Novipirellula maiorica TaxID=1265734 RepID=UPI000592B168|nr:hypothetical protein [Rhodopirellula maiorica]
MVTQTAHVYRYRVDASDMIVAVDQWWIAFARENNTTDLDEDSVVGKSLWDFISDYPTQRLYQEIHRFVRMTGNPITVPFRCDSPTLRRYMQLTIRRLETQELGYESVLLRAVPSRRLAILDPTEERSAAFLTMCSFCKRSLVEPSGWLEIENIAIKLRLYRKQTVPEIRYTVCPDCEDQYSNPKKQTESSTR